MPEHREGTPERLRELESFLWHDFENLEAWRTWTAKRGWGDAQGSYDDALCVRTALRALQGGNNGMEAAREDAERINLAIEQHDLRPRVSSDGGLAFSQSRADDPVGHVLALAVRAIADGAWKRFKLCRDESCRASYFDATRNGAKTWCSMASCGSRNKMRRFRARTGR